MAAGSKDLQALSQALKLEREGREFYLKAARETANQKGRAMFLSLADDERMHLETVERQLRAIEREGTYVDLPALEVRDIDLELKLFPPERQEAKERIGVHPNQLEALHVALDIEMRAHNLYRAAAKGTEDEAGNRMYRWLAHAEMTHFNLLMSNYESLVSLGGWI